ncbi:MAG: roadblock/LC7 domain-containing protein [Candidatus Bathyarchaeota archaeon]|nr:roadblock/LC7 domain-containing protein [Candidatus Bathyarchaeota archaeon]
MTEVITVNQTELTHENSIFANLAASLTQIRKLKGVLGYILRSDTSAIVDLPGKDTVCQYAILSAQMHDASLEVSQLFDLGQPESLIVEGKTAKLLCLAVGENKVSVFMEKDASHAWILKRVML